MDLTELQEIAEHEPHARKRTRIRCCVAAVTFDLGAPLSPIAEQGIVAALVRIVELAKQSSNMQ